ncbi:MAG: Macrolide export ATP-binding/permease protein MacB [Bacteroidetes bacterium MED-G17]|nr:MAG: hypothetical protein CBB99_03605 [Bacteroidetes bacterium TMED39]CAI8275180.1 MAG: Macrolide export ATP-binding/permease protein MacB [Bacteroidetes bacterium MED-G17]
MSKVSEILRLSTQSLRKNSLRSWITSGIITLGITALIGILTAIEGVESSISKNFSLMGSNTFNIQNKSSSIVIGGRRRVKRFPNIDYREAKSFQKQYNFSEFCSVFLNVSFTSQAKYKSKKTNPNIYIVGGDARYPKVAGYQILEGRSIGDYDVNQNSKVVVIGQEIKENLFGAQKAIGKTITLENGKFQVIGIFKEKQSAFDFGFNRIALVPIELGRQMAKGKNNYTIGVSVNNIYELEQASNSSRALFRRIRRLSASDEDNFTVVKSDNVSEQLINSLSKVSLFAQVIGIITLLGAAINLMNIMLVSVTERTKEIGTLKSVGAKQSEILWQFLYESLGICLLGAVLGIILGVGIGNLVSSFLGGSFLMPWNWVIIGLLLSLVTGLIAGIYPARKAAKINPIDALRYE